MKVLIILLVLSVVLFIMTLWREKKQKQMRGYFARNGIRKKSAVFKERKSRHSAKLRHQEPTLHSGYTENTKNTQNSKDLRGRNYDALSTDTLAAIKSHPENQFEEETAHVEILNEPTMEDTDEILGLKPKSSSSASLNKFIEKTPVYSSPAPSIAASLISRSVKHPSTPSNSAVPVSTAPAQTEIEDRFLLFGNRVIIYLKAAKEKPYGGYELLQNLLANHFRFGEMNIFHRHERNTGEGQRLFSLAAATKAGTFDLTKMGSFTCQGLSLFFSLNEVQNPELTFNLMLETALQLIADLGGTILDEQQQVITEEKVQLIRDNLQSLVMA